MRTPRPRIAVDLDGTMCDLTGALRLFAARHLGLRPADLPDPTDHHCSAWYPSETVREQVFHQAIVDGQIMAGLRPLPHAIEMVGQLIRSGHDVAYVTARAQRGPSASEQVRQTVTWLERYGLHPAALHFVRDKTTVTWDVLIDDAPENAEAAVRAGRHVVVSDAPWNQGVVAPRFSDWRDVPGLLSDLTGSLHPRRRAVEQA